MGVGIARRSGFRAPCDPPRWERAGRLHTSMFKSSPQGRVDSSLEWVRRQFCKSSLSEYRSQIDEAASEDRCSRIQRFLLIARQAVLNAGALAKPGSVSALAADLRQRTHRPTLWLQKSGFCRLPIERNQSCCGLPCGEEPHRWPSSRCPRAVNSPAVCWHLSFPVAPHLYRRAAARDEVCVCLWLRLRDPPASP